MPCFNVVQVQVQPLSVATVATSVEPPLQPVQNSKTLVQLLLDHLPHVAVDFIRLQQLLEGLGKLLQLLTLQGTQLATLLDLLAEL